MATPRQALRVVLYLAASAIALVAPTVAVGASPSTARPVAAPCVNGVVPLNPYVVNCNLPPRSKRIPGQAPDAGAIIACKGSPTCLSYFVNYPGQTVWDSGLWSPNER